MRIEVPGHSRCAGYPVRYVSWILQPTVIVFLKRIQGKVTPLNKYRVGKDTRPEPLNGRRGLKWEPNRWPSFFLFIKGPYGLQLSRYYRALSKNLENDPRGPGGLKLGARRPARQGQSADWGHLRVARPTDILVQGPDQGRQRRYRRISHSKPSWIRERPRLMEVSPMYFVVAQQQIIPDTYHPNVMYVLLVIYVTTASSTLHASGQGGGGK